MSKITNWLSGTLMVLFFISVAPGLITNIKNQYQDMQKNHVKVAVINIGEIKAQNNYSEQLTKHFKDDKIKAILLQIDSPGGLAGSSKAIFNDLQLLKKEYPKPIITLSINCCASAGYHIASATDYIIASPTAIIGSIGTAIGFFNISDVLKKYDVSYISKHSGEYKTVGTPYLPNNTEQEKMLQELSDSSYNIFINDVATCRNLELANHAKWANGRVFTGEQAHQLNLIDATGSKYNAVKKIKELTQSKDDDEITWIKEEEPSLLNQLLATKNQTKLSVDGLVDSIISKLESRFISCY